MISFSSPSQSPGPAFLPRSGLRGLSLLEISIAVMVLGMALAPLVIHFKEARRQSYDARNLMFATTAAVARLDQLSQDIRRVSGAIPPFPVMKTVQGGTTFTVTPSIDKVATAAFLHVKVDWTLPATPGKSHSIQLSSIVFLSH